MGCGVSGRKKIGVKTSIESDAKYKKIKSESTKGKNYVNDINEKAWKNIISFMSFCDLKEVGKTNKLFNYLVKQNKILVKFFKKKNNEIMYNIYAKKIFESFSILQLNQKRNNSIVSEYSTSSEKR